MKLFADTNIVAVAVRELRGAGHDVIYSAERPTDPGDEALLAEAAAAGRVFRTKDHDIGALVHRDGRLHAGVLLLDDLGDPAEEAWLIAERLERDGDRLAAGAFLRAPLGRGAQPTAARHGRPLCWPPLRADP